MEVCAAWLIHVYTYMLAFHAAYLSMDRAYLATCCVFVDAQLLCCMVDNVVIERN
jgi:uncharacterized membrane protein YcfT